MQLGLATLGYESHLLRKHSCCSSSTTVELNGLMGLQSDTPNLAPEGLWALTELHKIPDLGYSVLANQDTFSRIISLTRSPKAADFRGWMHENSDLSPKEIQQEFVCLTVNEPWYKQDVASWIIWGVINAIGVIPGIGPLVGIPLSLLEKILGYRKGHSPKYFISELQALTMPKQ